MKFLTLLFFIPFLCFAEDWKINDQHTQVQFNIDYMGVMEITGLFTQTRGKFEYDVKNQSAKNVLVQIASKSIQTHNKKRDNHLRRADFLAVSTYPWIEFHIDQVNLTPGKRRVEGELYLRGVRKKIHLNMFVEGLKPDPWDEGKESLFLRVEGKIKRSEFGLTWNKTLDKGGVLVGDEIRIKVDIEANPSDQKLAFSRFYLPSDGVTKSKKLIPAHQLPKDEPTYEVDLEEKAPIELAPKNATNPASVIIGFFLFITITAASLWLKIKLQNQLTTKLNWSNLKSEIISDLVLLAFVIATFAATAPLMGYGD